MNPLKLWYYPNGFSPIHDAAGYSDAVPFCNVGRRKWVDLVGPSEAEYFYCGQIPDFVPNPFDTSAFTHLKECPARHIVDLEGDYRPGSFRREFDGCIRIASGAPLAWRDEMVFARPTLSKLLLQIVRANHHFEFPTPTANTWFFRGKPDSGGVREKMRAACQVAELPMAIEFLPEWNGPSPIGSPVHDIFKREMSEHAVALCPQGEGVATARFYEACAMGRFPVVIGETLLLGHDVSNLGFVEMIPAELSVAEMAEEFKRINEIPLAEMIERGQAAQRYFDTIVRPYFSDPTAAFITWLRSKVAGPPGV